MPLTGMCDAASKDHGADAPVVVIPSSSFPSLQRRRRQNAHSATIVPSTPNPPTTPPTIGPVLADGFEVDVEALLDAKGSNEKGHVSQ